jgi:hypothetical protein
MTGEQLYALYEQAHDERNCKVDAWQELPPEDHTAWNRVAELALGETEERLAKLSALEAGGVDNWDGYDWAMESLHKENEDG